MKFLALTIYFILQLNSCIQAESHYTVIGPGTIHAERKYNVAVAVYQTTQTCQLKVGITGPSYNETKVVDLSAGIVKNIEFDVPKLSDGDYYLTAEGLSGIIFQNTTKLNWADVEPYVKIQTDKGIYKPGDVVHFRAIFLDENAKPIEPPPQTSLWIEDAKRNRIKQFQHLKVVRGVYSGQFQISDFPVLGNWRLFLPGKNSYPRAQVYFDVAKYVLPKYNVKVEATEKLSVRDGDLQVVVRSNYTYGEPVNAKVTLLLNLAQTYTPIKDQDSKQLAPILIKNADMVNGKAKFDWNIKEYAAYITERNTPIRLEITATVEEYFTGIQKNGTTSSFLYPYRYYMNCLNTRECTSYKADEETEVFIKLALVDNTPLQDSKSMVKLTYTETIRKQYYWRGKENEASEPVEPKIEAKQHVFTSYMNDSGIASFKVKLPSLEEYDGYAHYYDVEAAYTDEARLIYNAYERRALVSTYKWEEPKDYFKLHVNYVDKKYNFKVGESVVITVNSSEPLTYFTYTIVGRGNMLLSDYVTLPEPAQIYNLSVPTTLMMAPFSRIYVYYINDIGNLTYYETSFLVELELQNSIELTAAAKVQPGEDVAIDIKTTPNSFVGLMAVDQSALLLKRNNDVGPFDIQSLIRSYSTYTSNQGGFTRYPGELTGVVTLTNANYFYNKTRPNTRFPDSPREPPVRSGVNQSVGAVASYASYASKNEIKIRKDFSETWIFADIENTETGNFTWVKKVPDTITSWMLTGFSLNPIKGFGITKEPTMVTTFQPFFVAIRLPYAVKRGEVINVPALVFNYLDKDLDVEVTLDNTDAEFDFIEITNDVINEPKRSKAVRVPANGAKAVSFYLSPKVIGNIMLKFTAISPIAADAVHKTLKVVPEGVTEYANRAYFINLKDINELKDSFILELPAEVVPDSEHIELSVVGDLLGPMLNNLDNLMRLPLGCGEQTISAMLPNFLILNYLQSTNKLTPMLETKLKYNLERGYQNMLSYRHKDGSFSAFGPSSNEQKPRNGSTWLTSYVLRSLSKMKQHIDVDGKILQEALHFLLSKQAENGSFIENGEYIFKTQNDHIKLTASVLLAIKSFGSDAADKQLAIDKTYSYILENWQRSEDLLAKAFATYALQEVNHTAAIEQLHDLQSLAVTKDDRMWWSYNAQAPTQDASWWRWSFSHDVELTAYVLLTLLDQQSEKTFEKVLPIIKWLVAQRNSLGGFSSTQDTVVGLEALMRFALQSGYEAAVMDIEFTAKAAIEKSDVVKVNQENALLMQTTELPQKTTSLDFTAKGKGAALVQISYQYNVVEKQVNPSFSINNVINTETPEHKLKMNICVEYTGTGDNSNMAVLEISLPSGYIANMESFERINKVERVRLIETKNADTLIVIYFESLHKQQTQCLPIEAYKTFAVALQKPASIVLYDYYDTTQKATIYYKVFSKLCKLCEETDECNCP